MFTEEHTEELQDTVPGTFSNETRSSDVLLWPIERLLADLLETGELQNLFWKQMKPNETRFLGTMLQTQNLAQVNFAFFVLPRSNLAHHENRMVSLLSDLHAPCSPVKRLALEHVFRSST